MERLHDDTPSLNPAKRRGFSGEGERPWLAVWLVLMERAMQAEGGPAGRMDAWKASLGAFLLEFRRHPRHLTPEDIREYLFRRCELGAGDTPQSLTTAMEALSFFYRAVVPRPALAEAARHPFDHPALPPLPESDFTAPGLPSLPRDPDSPLLKLLREKLVENGAPAFCAIQHDWRPA